MAVVEAYVGEKKIDHPENKSELSPMLYSLLIEGIAQNTNGAVYASEVNNSAKSEFADLSAV
jgi:Ca2+-transporting ATPase